MKKVVSILTALLVLSAICALPIAAASPSAAQWHAIQDENAPNRTVATAEKGRVTVTSKVESDKEPGGCGIVLEQPVDLSDFEVTFSLDSYTKCQDQYLAIGFSSGKLTDWLYGDTEHPGFMILLRPTDTPNEISCGEGLLNNWDADRKIARVGKTSFAPGHYFEGTVNASWTNIKFAVKRNSANDGYDVYINDVRINNENKWSFADDIAATTDGKWYLQMNFKDGEYQPATFTIKTINGEPAVDQSASGRLPGSYGSTGATTTAPAPTNKTTASAPANKTTAPASANKTTAPAPANKTTAPEAPVDGTTQAPESNDGATSVPGEPDNGTMAGDSSSTQANVSDVGTPSDSGMPSDGNNDNSDADSSGDSSTPADADGGLGAGAIAAIVIGALIVLGGAGAAVYFLVIKKKKAA